MNEQEISSQIKDKVKQSVREASPWLVWLGRFGYVVKGVVFILVGVLATYAAIGAGAANDGARSALRHIAELPFGQFLLVVVAIGLVSYALWQVIQAFMDTENKGSTVKGFAVRASYAGGALIYIGLAFSAVKIFLGARRSDGIWARSWTAWLLAQPFGQWLVGLAGTIVIGVGFYQFYKAYCAKFRENLLLAEMSETEDKWATRFGRFGFAARGIVFCVIGFFLVLAAWQTDAGETRGLGGALHAVEQQIFGAWLLGIVAAGFISYGLFMFVLAKYRRMVIT
ncbi:MAG TPA: DUF1206 domain-containing protein [Pyrinomonadaceae bacterium]|nr:DUF1206 domain-containing protein [Pyrinomonadaceae bacterium]